jgi:hypothetical protein
VRFDIEAIEEGGSMTLLAADVPFSAVADTILAPLLAYCEMTDPPRAKLPLTTRDESTADPRKADLSQQVSPKE